LSDFTPDSVAKSDKNGWWLNGWWLNGWR